MSTVVQRIRRIELNVSLIKHYSSFKLPDGRMRVQFNDLVEQVKDDTELVESELKSIKELWKKVKPITKGIL